MSGDSMKNIDYLEKIKKTIKNNASKDVESSYTAKLIGDIELLSKKIGEEATEVIVAALSQDKENLKNLLKVLKNNKICFANPVTFSSASESQS